MNGKEATKQKHMKQKSMVYEPCRHNLFKQDEISYSLGPDSDKKNHMNQTMVLWKMKMIFI